MNRPPDPELERRLRRWLHDHAETDDAWQAAVDGALEQTARQAQRRRRWTMPRWRMVALPGALAAVAAVVLLIAVQLLQLPGSDIGSETPASAVPAAERLRSSIAVGGGHPALSVAVDDRAVWLLRAAVERHEPSTGALMSSHALPGNPCGPIVFGAGYAWTRACLSGPTEEVRVTWLLQFDQADGSLVLEIRFPTPIGFQPALLNGQIWVISDLRFGELSTVDPASGEITFRGELGGTSTHAVGAFGAVWVSRPGVGVVTRVDPATGGRADIPVGGRPGSIAATDGAVWVGSSSDRGLRMIDPEAREIIATIPLGGATGQIQTLDGEVWVLTSTRIERVDVGARRVIDAIEVGAHSVSLPPQFRGQAYSMWVGQEVWYAAPDGREVLRLSR